MNNKFQYTKTEGQGWLVEKPEIEKPALIVNAPKHLEREIYEMFTPKWQAYIKHINTLRRFKYSYPDPKKEMELGKDFEQFECENCDGCGWHEGGKTLKTTCVCCGGIGVIAIQKKHRAEQTPITQRTYSEQEAEEIWNAAQAYGVDLLYESQNGIESKMQDKQQFFRTRFGIEIK